MDFDGFTLLMEKDFKEFETMNKKSKKQSLETLRKNYNYWLDHYKDAVEKYWNLDQDEKDKNVATFLGKITYFLYLSKFGWISLGCIHEKTSEGSKTEQENQKNIQQKIKEIMKNL